MDIKTYEEILGVHLVESNAHPQLLNNDRMNYQRKRIEQNVLRLMWNFDVHREKHSIVAQRPDGSMYIINGQHHAEAAIRLSILSVPIFVFKSQGPEEESIVFGKFQDWQFGKVKNVQEGNENGV